MSNSTFRKIFFTIIGILFFLFGLLTFPIISSMMKEPLSWPYFGFLILPIISLLSGIIYLYSVFIKRDSNNLIFAASITYIASILVSIVGYFIFVFPCMQSEANEMCIFAVFIPLALTIIVGTAGFITLLIGFIKLLRKK